MKKNGSDQPALSGCSACNFCRMQENDAIIIIQLHGHGVGRESLNLRRCASLPLLQPSAPAFPQPANAMGKTCPQARLRLGMKRETGSRNVWSQGLHF